MVLADIYGIIEVDSLHDFIVQYRNDSRFIYLLPLWSNEKGIHIDDIVDDGIDGYVENPDLELEEILKIADDVYILEDREPYGYIIIEVGC